MLISLAIDTHPPTTVTTRPAAPNWRRRRPIICVYLKLFRPHPTLLKAVLSMCFELLPGRTQPWIVSFFWKFLEAQRPFILRIKVRGKDGGNQSLLGCAKHPICVCKSLRQFECVFGKQCGGQLMGKPLLHPSQINLVPTSPAVEAWGMLAWPASEIRAKNLESGALDSRRLFRPRCHASVSTPLLSSLLQPKL